MKLITNKNYNVGIDNLSDKKIMFDFAKEIYFDGEAPGKKRPRYRSVIWFLKSPAIMVSGISTFSYQDILINFVID